MTDGSDHGRELMLRLRAGDDEALTELVRRYGPRVESFFLRSGVDPSFAEDLCQEVFLRVYRAKDRYEPTARFRTWLHRIVHRIAINDGLRNRWRRSLALVEREDPDTPAMTLPPAAGEDPLRRMEREEERRQLRRAVANLPAVQRTALLLHRFEGLSYEELGAILEMSTAALKSLLFRARANVRRALECSAAKELGDEPRS